MRRRGFAVKRQQVRQNRQTAYYLGDEAECTEVLRCHMAHEAVFFDAALGFASVE